MAEPRSLLVFGATGATGRHFVAQALAEGHRVRALVRTPSKLAVESDRLEVRQGAITDPLDLDELVGRTDAVAVMLGDRESQRHTRINAAFTPKLVAAMRRQGVRRLLYQARAFSRPPGGRLGPVLWALRHTLARPYLGQHRDNEAVMAFLAAEAGDLVWTVHRAAIGSDGPSQGILRPSDTRLSVATFRDCAAYNLSSIMDASAIRAISLSHYAAKKRPI